jgi:hypothetical protein
VQQIWYVAYGSNLSYERFCCYLRGGQLPGTDRVYPGCRNSAVPLDDVATFLTGGVYFAGRSSVWRSGMACYDPEASGRVPARAYLITSDQFVDVLAQETRREPGLSLDLTPALRGDRFSSGLGGYSILVRAGDRDGIPLITFTADRRGVGPDMAPSEEYLSAMATGLSESHGWSAEQAERYLASLCGAAERRSPVQPAATSSAAELN